MQETSALYRQILSSTDYFFETRVVIGDSGNLITEGGEQILFGGTAIVVARTGPDSGFDENIIFSVKTSLNMFDNEPVIGKAVAGEINLEIIQPSGDIPRMGVVIPYVRAIRYEDEQEISSEWLQQGTFFIDTRETSHNDDGLEILTLHGYDAMLKAEQDYASTNLNWPALDTAVVSEIASKMGVSVDARTWAVMTDGYTFPIPASFTLREMLGYIAGAYAGCFIMTELGQLRLVTMTELPKETKYLVDEYGYVLTFGGTRILI